MHYKPPGEGAKGTAAVAGCGGATYASVLGEPDWAGRRNVLILFSESLAMLIGKLSGEDHLDGQWGSRAARSPHQQRRDPDPTMPPIGC